MSKSAKPGWPDLTALPFQLFGAQAPAPPTASPLSQGLASGMDAVNKFWGSLPGGTAVPGFLVPTLDVGELDKRIADLRAAEQWVEVNLNMLRATIQGLEVQRHTIAAIHSISMMADGGAAEAPAGLPTGWPMSATAAPPVRTPAPAPEPVPADPAPVAAAPAGSADSADSAEAKPDAPNSLLGLAANNWLGLLQDQFSRVAQAAAGASSAPPAAARKTAVPAKATSKAAAKRGAKAGRTG